MAHHIDSDKPGFWACVFDEGAEVLEQRPSTRHPHSLTYSASWCATGVVRRASEFFHRQEVDGIGVLAVYGHIDPRVLQALAHAEYCFKPDFVDLCVNAPERVPRSFAGSYQVLVVNEREHSVTLLLDHLASRPTFTARSARRCSFGSSGSQVLRMVGREPELSLEGALGFVALGYPIAPATLMEGVQRVPIGHSICLSHTKGGASVAVRRTWGIQYSEPRPVTLEMATDELDAVLTTEHRRAAAPPQRTREAHEVGVLLALTGGLDSRLMLGLVKAVSSTSVEAFTWRATSDSRLSDAAVAAELACEAGVPHTVLDYRAGTLLLNLPDAIGSPELLTDNLGHIAAGQGLLRSNGLIERPVLIGDQILGHGPRLESEAEAVSYVIGMPWPIIGSAFDSVVEADGLEVLRAHLYDRVCHLVSAVPEQLRTPKNIQLSLSLGISVQGWLLGPGFYKEPEVEARRPMLSSEALDLVASWPDRLRIDKRVLVNLLQRRFPELASVRHADAAAGLVDWDSALAMSSALRGMLRSTNTDRLSDLLGFRVSSHGVDAAEGGRRRPRVYAGLKRRAATTFVGLRRRFGLVPGLEHAFRLMWPPRRSAAGPSRLKLAFRLALLDKVVASMDGELASGSHTGHG